MRSRGVCLLVWVGVRWQTPEALGPEQRMDLTQWFNTYISIFSTYINSWPNQKKRRMDKGIGSMSIQQNMLYREKEQTDFTTAWMNGWISKIYMSNEEARYKNKHGMIIFIWIFNKFLQIIFIWIFYSNRSWKVVSYLWGWQVDTVWRESQENVLGWCVQLSNLINSLEAPNRDTYDLTIFLACKLCL